MLAMPTHSKWQKRPERLTILDTIIGGNNGGIDHTASLVVGGIVLLKGTGHSTSIHV